MLRMMLMSLTLLAATAATTTAQAHEVAPISQRARVAERRIEGRRIRRELRRDWREVRRDVRSARAARFEHIRWERGLRRNAR